MIDKNKRVVYQFKAPIYRKSPFMTMFDYRHEIPATIFHQSVLMLLSHELAHIGNGHLKLIAKDKAYRKYSDHSLAAPFWEAFIPWRSLIDTRPSIIT